jgi:lipopolysaccharide export system permease protein
LYEHFGLKEQIVAEKAEWHESGWVLQNGTDRHFTGGSWSETSFAERTVRLPFRPRDFIVIDVRPEQMSTPEYLSYLRQLRMLSVPSEKEQIQFQQRWAAAFSHLIVMMIGIPFALGLGSKHGKMISFTFALIFAFMYWGVQAVGLSLGENKVLPPVMAAWLGNVVFGIAGVYALRKVQK